MGVGQHLWLSQTWFFPYYSYVIVVCFNCRKQNYTFKPLFTAQLWILLDSSGDLEGPTLCDHEPDTGFQSCDEGSPVIKGERYPVITKWLLCDLEITEYKKILATMAALGFRTTVGLNLFEYFFKSWSPLTPQTLLRPKIYCLFLLLVLFFFSPGARVCLNSVWNSLF